MSLVFPETPEVRNIPQIIETLRYVIRGALIYQNPDVVVAVVVDGWGLCGKRSIALNPKP